MKEIKFVEDSNGNTCYVNYFGSIVAAQKALDSLVDCKNCINCSNCSYCFNCSRCSSCSNCSDCSYCAYCSRCSYCSYCFYCAECTRCADCSDCYSLKDVVYELKPSYFVPKIENIDKVIYAACSVPDALNMDSWHTCETTHCRAGWVVHLAGEAGKELEMQNNTLLAAQLIYRESGSPINPCRFFDSNKEAMADMKARAEAFDDFEHEIEAAKKGETK